MSQFVGIFWILKSFKFYWNRFYIFIVIIFELFPFVSVAFEEQIESFIKKSKDNTLGISLIDKSISCHRSVWHLNVTYLIIVDHSVASVSAHTWKWLSYNEFEGVFDFVSHQEADVGHLVISVDNAYLFLLVLDSYHAGEDCHLNSNYRNYYKKLRFYQRI